MPRTNGKHSVKGGGWRMYHFLKPTQELSQTESYSIDIWHSSCFYDAPAENHHVPPNFFCKTKKFNG